MAETPRRSAERVPVRLPVDCSHEGNFVLSESVNISATGMFICSTESLPVGAPVALVFSIGEVHELSVRARVVWCGPKGLGVQFVDPPKVLQDAVLALVRRVAVVDPVVTDS